MRSLFLACWCVAAAASGWTHADSIPALMPTHRNVVYGEAGGQKQLLDIFYPGMQKPRTPAPAILCIHGGAWRGGSKNDMGIVTLPLTKADFVCVCVGYRLFDPKKHPDNIWPTQVDDVQRAVRFLRANAANYGIDQQRLGAIGFSAGGHLAALLGTTDTRDNGDAALAKYSSRVQAVVDVFGPSDLTMDYSHLKMGDGTVQDLLDDFIGRSRSRDVIAKCRRDASPLFAVDRNSAPHLLYHGSKDPIVPVENSRKFHAALRKAGVDSDYVELKDEGHTISPPHIPGFIDKITAFFRRTLAAKQ
ncbi:MAG: alpha/beta hydrolase [Verrucomicrobiales bacterium]|nr:alpha/beta hydrolase [Verrucomicrobiales bacterium]